jgi:hypothetical protein
MPLCRLMPPVAMISGARPRWYRPAAMRAGAAWLVPRARVDVPGAEIRRVLGNLAISQISQFGRTRPVS